MARKEFQVHLLNDAGIAKAAIIASIFSEALTALEACIPPGRGLALVITKLQEASFFAKREMAMDPANQKAE